MKIIKKKSFKFTKTISDFKKFLTKETKRSFFYVHEPDIQSNDYFNLKNCVLKNQVSASGDFEKKLELEIKKITKAKFVILTNSGTSALHISCIVSGVKKNDEVLVPAFTFVASANAVKYCDAEPHFIDIEPENFTINVKKLDSYLQKNTYKKNNLLYNKKTKKIIRAIMPVHPYGHPCNMVSIQKLAKKYNLKIIEDAADALGSYYNGKHVGTFGDIGIISFNGNKIITSGAGGAILTNKKNLAKRCRHLISTAKIIHPYKLIHNEIGFNYRISNINAALAHSQIKRFYKILKKKRSLYKKYSLFFKNNPYFKLVSEPRNSQSNYWLQTIIVNKKNNREIKSIIKIFFNKKIYVRLGWELMSKLRPFNKCPKMNLSIATTIQPRIINLPSSSFLIR